MEFPRQEYWSGWPFPSSGDLPDPGTEPSSPTMACSFFTVESPGKSTVDTYGVSLGGSENDLVLNSSNGARNPCIYQKATEFYILKG